MFFIAFMPVGRGVISFEFTPWGSVSFLLKSRLWALVSFLLKSCLGTPVCLLQSLRDPPGIILKYVLPKRKARKPAGFQKKTSPPRRDFNKKRTEVFVFGITSRSLTCLLAWSVRQNKPKRESNMRHVKRKSAGVNLPGPQMCRS